MHPENIAEHMMDAIPGDISGEGAERFGQVSRAGDRHRATVLMGASLLSFS